MKRIGPRRLLYWRLVTTPLSAWSGWGRYRVALWLPVAVGLVTAVMVLAWR